MIVTRHTHHTDSKAFDDRESRREPTDTDGANDDSRRTPTQGQLPDSSNELATR